MKFITIVSVVKFCNNISINYGNAIQIKIFAGTRPLSWTFVQRGLNLFYAHDGNKNVSDVFFLALQNGIAAHYEYAPFGGITYTSKNTPYTIDLIAANRKILQKA